MPDKTRWRLTLNAPATDTLAFRVAGISDSDEIDAFNRPAIFNVQTRNYTLR